MDKPRTAGTRRMLLFLTLIPILVELGCAGSANPTGGEPESSSQSRIEPPAPREGMIHIPAGSFLIGSNEAQFEAYLSQSTMNFPGMAKALRKQFVIPYRPLDLPQFYIQEFEVTNREYKEFLGSTGYRPSQNMDYLSHWEGGQYPDWATDFPVVWVSVEDAQSYCQWRGSSLPSEEQWEKASRGASGRAFPWGNTFPGPETANFGRDQAEPIGNRAGDISPYQVYDLAGNVSEWTSSRTQLDGQEFLVIRGGSFALPARDTLSARRRYKSVGQPETRFKDVGFRCAAN